MARSGKLLSQEGVELVRQMIEQERVWQSTPFDAPGYATFAPPWYPKPQPFAGGTIEALEWLIAQNERG